MALEPNERSMEYAQERIATLHHLSAQPVGFEGLEAVLERAAIVVPMTDREHDSPAATGVLTALESIEPSPNRVVVPVRADPDRIDDMRVWLESFDLPVSVLWCTAPEVREVLTAQGLDGSLGKGRDVWLALGAVLEYDDVEYVVVHDADSTSYRADHVARLLRPLAAGYEFSKGYYARVENERLYGRLCRLFYEPTIRTLARNHDEPILEYLGAFRYALAGEFAMTTELARALRPPRSWGLEVATLGDAFRTAGFDGSAQVDLGIHRHEHRVVDGDDGLEGMSRAVATALLRVLENGGVDIDYESLPSAYRETADRLVEQYRADAAFNELTYDADAERAQVDRYAESLERPPADSRLPAWNQTTLDGTAVREATTAWTTESRGAAGTQRNDPLEPSAGE